MDNYMDHLLVLDELSTGLIKHASDKAYSIANQAVDDNKNLRHQASLANSYGRNRAFSHLSDQADKAAKVASNKYAQGGRLRDAYTFRNKTSYLPSISKTY